MTIKQACYSTAGLLLLAVVSQGVQAQSDLKIGFVNLPALIQNAPQIADLTNQIQDEFAQANSDFEAMAEEFDEKREVYQRDESVMSEADRTALQRELTRLERDLQRRQSELQEEFNIRQNELLQELQIEVVGQVQDYAAAEGYDIVLTDVIYRSESVDITAEVFGYIRGLAEGSAASSDE